MLQSSSDIVALCTLAIAMLVVVSLLKRPVSGVVLGVVVMICECVLLTRAAEADIQRAFRMIDAKKARGEELSLGDQLFDGTGERVAVLFIGWLPGGVGIVIGSLLVLGVRRFRGRRRPRIPHVKTKASTAVVITGGSPEPLRGW